MAGKFHQGGGIYILTILAVVPGAENIDCGFFGPLKIFLVSFLYTCQRTVLEFNFSQMMDVHKNNSEKVSCSTKTLDSAENLSLYTVVYKY